MKNVRRRACQDSSELVTRERHVPTFFTGKDGTTFDTGSVELCTECKSLDSKAGDDHHAKYKKEAEKWRTLAHEKEMESARLMQQLEDTKVQMKSLTDEKSALEDKLHETRSVLKRKVCKIERLKGASKELGSRYDAASQENAEMKDVIREMNAILGRMKNALVKSQKRCETLKSQRKEISQQFTRQVKSNEELKRKILDFEEDLKDFQEVRSELREKTKLIEHGISEQANVAAILECEPDSFEEEWIGMSSKLKDIKDWALKSHAIKDELDVALEQLHMPPKRVAETAQNESQFVRILTNQLTIARREIEHLNAELGKRQEAKQYYRVMVEQYSHLARQVADLFQSLVSPQPSTNLRGVILSVVFAKRMRNGMIGQRVVNERALLFPGRIQMSPSFQLKEIRHKFTELTQDLLFEKQKLSDLIDVQIRRDELSKEVARKETERLIEQTGTALKDRIAELQSELSQCVSNEVHAELQRLNDELTRDNRALTEKIIQLQSALAGDKVLIDSLCHQVDTSKHQMRKLRNRLSKQEERSLLDSSLH